MNYIGYHLSEMQAVLFFVYVVTYFFMENHKGDLDYCLSSYDNNLEFFSMASYFLPLV